MKKKVSKLQDQMNQATLRETIVSRLLEEKRFEDAAEALKSPEKMKALMDEFCVEK